MSKLSSALRVEFVRFIIASLFFSMVLCLIFSAFVKGLYLGPSAVNIGRTVIKIISILAASLYAVLKPEKGLIKGTLWGLAYCFASFILFSILSGGVNMANLSIIDVLFCCVSGLISGIIAVNVKK